MGSAPGVGALAAVQAPAAGTVSQMKFARQQILGSLLLALIVVIIVLIRAWPVLCTNESVC
jgi:hypothetical protein